MKHRVLALIVGMASLIFMYGCGGRNSNEGTASQIENEASEEILDANSVKINEKMFNYKVVSERYCKENIDIEYPQISGLSTDAESKLNDFIKNEIDKFGFEGVRSKKENFEIKTMDENFVSILIRGVIEDEVDGYVSNYAYTYNIDLTEGKFKRLASTGKTAEYAAKMFNGDYIIKNEDSIKEGLTRTDDFFGESLLYREGYDSRSEEEIKEVLDEFDIDIDNAVSSIPGYSYYENGKTVLCIAGSQAIGGYIELVLG